jgi:hypothetical protein
MMNKIDNTKFFIVSRISNNDSKDSKDSKWDWFALSSNPKITIQIIAENTDLPWDWSEVSINKNTTWNTIQLYPNLPWDWNALSLNKNITFDIVKDNIEKPWNWAFLSQNANMTWDIVQANLDYPWEFAYYSKNPNLTFKIVRKNLEKGFNELNENMDNYRPSLINERTICKLAHMNWLWENAIPYTLLWETVADYPENWSWNVISKIPNVPLEFIQNNLDKPWDLKILSTNTNVTWAFVHDNQEKEWDWKALSGNPGILELTDANKIYANKVLYIQRKWRVAISDPNYDICKRRILRECKELLDDAPINNVLAR